MITAEENTPTELASVGEIIYPCNCIFEVTIGGRRDIEKLVKIAETDAFLVYLRRGNTFKPNFSPEFWPPVKPNPPIVALKNSTFSFGEQRSR